MTSLLGIFEYDGVRYEVTTFIEEGFGVRVVRFKTVSLGNWLSLSQAERQDAVFESGGRRYPVVITSVDPQYDLEPENYVGEVAAVTFVYALKK